MCKCYIGGVISKLVYVDRHVIDYLMDVSIGCGALMVRLSSVSCNMCNKMKIKVLMYCVSAILVELGAN